MPDRGYGSSGLIKKDYVEVVRELGYFYAMNEGTIYIKDTEYLASTNITLKKL